MKACKDCHYLFEEGDKCPACGSENISEKFTGLIIILDPERSEVAKKIGAKTPGRYAVKVR